jgi:hypothetical protein
LFRTHPFSPSWFALDISLPSKNASKRPLCET